MHWLSMLAAGGGGDLLVGILIGCCLGILVGPGFRAWQTHREWIAASREAGFTDRLLDRIERDAGPDVWRPLSELDDATEPTWRTRR
jgi:hypothetical protein